MPKFNVELHGLRAEAYGAVGESNYSYYESEGAADAIEVTDVEARTAEHAVRRVRVALGRLIERQLKEEWWE